MGSQLVPLLIVCIYKKSENRIPEILSSILVNAAFDPLIRRPGLENDHSFRRVTGD